MATQDQQAENAAKTNHEANNQPSNHSSASSDASDYLYTPPSPMSSMTSTSTSTSNPADPASTSMSDSANSTASPTSANISVREYIYFLPYPLPTNTPIPYSINLPAKNPLHLPTTLFEPTSTLVLTSPNNVFVDLRFYKSFAPGQTPLPNAGESSRLEWGFAGTNASVPTTDKHVGEGEEPWPNISHSTWTHFVDSRYTVGSTDIPRDEGDMYPINSTLTLEFGHMYQPDLKAVKTHEEMWKDVPVLRTADGGGKKCVVMRLHDDEVGARGVIVKVGQFCQGIVMVGRECAVERWEFEGTMQGSGFKGEAMMSNSMGGGGGGAKSENEGWERTARTGDLFLPCAVTWRTEVLCVGGKVKYRDYEWIVEEVWE